VDKAIAYPIFLSGGGEMGELTRSFDWSATAIGDPHDWPQSLRTTVAMILSSKFPMFLWWGDDLIQFYNDAYRPSLGNNGKHPLALGQKGKDCWPEIWDIIYPLIKQVVTTGGATWSEDQLVPIYRNGAIEDVYWTFGYSPITGESGKVEGVLVVCTETTEKVNNLKKLAESKEELEFAIEAAELGTWDLNPVTNKFTANTRLKIWFGLKPSDEVELALAIDSIAEKDKKRVAEAIQYSLSYESGGFYDIEYTIVNTVTNQERIVRAKGRAWFTDDKKAYRFNGTLQDITEEAIRKKKLAKNRQSLELAVSERTKELQQSNEDLQQFAHVASHDLQEPVRKIKIFSGRLKNDKENTISQNSLSYLNKIEQAAERMTNMIEGVLKYSTLNGREQLIEVVDLNKIISDVLSDMELSIHHKNAIIEYGGLPVIEGAPVLIHQLFYNLINNSLKFSKLDVCPRVRVKSEKINYEGDEFVKIYFEDNGIGFGLEDKENIFEAFTRLNSKDKYEGTGLGLALCKKIASRHHGDILAESLNGSGSLFMITLPVKQKSKII
jgi:signal transduction histidine kinase